MTSDDDTPTEHVYGNPAAGSCVVEFGDFECPYCAGAAPVLRELVQSSNGGIRLIFRHFPLFEPHPHALTAALAAEAVANSAGGDAFWLMHDKLFAHQNRLSDDDLRLYARLVGGDADLATGDPAQRFAPIVQADYAAGLAVGVSSTPTLFIDGVGYEGRIDLRSLQHATARISPDVAASVAVQTRRRPWQRR